MNPFRILVMSALWAAVNVAQAEDGIKTVYSISSDQTTVTTTATNNNKFDASLDGYLFPSLRKALQGMAFVTSVTQTKGEVSTESYSWSDYDTLKRKSHAFVNFNLQTPITLLFELEETYRKCKTTTSSAGTSTSSCSKQSDITVKGPVAVYGNYANSINVDSLLRDKQGLTVTLAKSWDGKDTTLTSAFQVKSVNFDESLGRFFRVFNIPVFVSGGDVGVGGSLLDKISPLTSRQRLMLGVSRVARAANERMFQL